MIALWLTGLAYAGPVVDLVGQVDVGGATRRTVVGSTLREPLLPAFGLGVRVASRSRFGVGGHLRLRSWQTSGLAGFGRRGFADLGGVFVAELAEGSWVPVVGGMAGLTIGVPAIAELESLVHVGVGGHVDAFAGVRRGRWGAEVGWTRAMMRRADPTSLTTTDQLALRLSIRTGRIDAR